MRRLLSVVAFLSMILFSVDSISSAAFAAKSGDSQKVVKWKMGHVASADHPWHKIALKFADLVKQKTNGQLIITVYPNSELGSEMDVLNGILSGTMEMTMSGETLANWTPYADLVAAYYAYDNEDHVIRTINSEVGQTIKEQIEKAGFKPLFYSLRTPRNLTANKPIRTPADVKNLRLRLSNTPLAIKCWSSLGVNVNVMPLSEVFTALNQGVIDAQENPYDLIYTNSFYEVQKYVNETEHVYSYIYFLCGVNQFNALPENVKESVLEAAKEVQLYSNELYYHSKDGYKELCIDKGMIIVSDVQRDEFAKAMQPAIKEYFDGETYALYEKIRSMAH